MNIFWLNSNTEYNIILEKYKKQKDKEELREDYYEGKQWKKWMEGIVTRNWTPAIDKRKTEKNYVWVVINLSKDCVWTMTNLVSWTEWVHTNIDDVKDIKFKLNDLIKRISDDLHIYKRTYLELSRFWEEIHLDHIEPEQVVKSNWAHYVITEVWKEDCQIVKYVTEYIRLEDNSVKEINYIQFLRKDGKVEETDYLYLDFNPLFNFETEDCYLDDLIALQDFINIMATQEFEINKYQWSPAFAFKNVAPVDAWWQAINPSDLTVWESNILFIWADWSAERIQAWSVTQEFRQSYDNLVKTLYKTAKLNWLKNEDIWSVQSWYSIELKLMDTLAHVKKIRIIILEWFKKIFWVLEETLGVEELYLEFSDAISKDIKNKLEEQQMKIEMADKMKYLGIDQEFLWKFIGLTEEEIEEIKVLKEKNKQIVVENEQIK